MPCSRRCAHRSSRNLLPVISSMRRLSQRQVCEACVMHALGNVDLRLSAPHGLAGHPLEFTAAAGGPTKHSFQLEVEAVREPRGSAAPLAIEGAVKGARTALSEAHPGQ